MGRSATAFGLLVLSILASDEVHGDERFAKMEAPSAAEAGGPRRWEVASDGAALRRAPSGSAEVARRLDAGKTLPNVGCQAAVGEVWCAVRIGRGPAMGHVALADLRPARGADGTVPTGPNDSPQRAARGDFDARGSLACAQTAGAPLGPCTYGVARSGGGDATLRVTFFNGFARLLYFEQGTFTAANGTMSGIGTDTAWHRDGARLTIRVDDQRYLIDESAVFGN